MEKENQKNGLPAEIVMETSSRQYGDYNKHLFEDLGQIVYLNNNYYIRYEEKMEDVTTPVTIKIAPDSTVNLIRQGDQVNRMTFDSGKITTTQYKTDIGTLEMEVKTTSLKISYYDRPFAGKISVDYSLHAGENHLGDFQIRLRFTT